MLKVYTSEKYKTLMCQVFQFSFKADSLKVLSTNRGSCAAEMLLWSKF